MCRARPARCERHPARVRRERSGGALPRHGSGLRHVNTGGGGAIWTAASTGLGSLRTVALAIDPTLPEVLHVGTDDAGVAADHGTDRPK
ncbi:MAG: hypothetical protein FJ144_19290 [Deltaproteobacteria bacterium]|nr:hypothetical protein [Deltaproteobacteria bacterium]